MSEVVTKLEPSQEVAERPTNSADAIISVIERAVSNPDVDIDKMERLLAMQERVMARQAEQAFNEAMMAAQADIQPVARDAYNSHTKSRYARLETISRAITPIITNHGFAMSFGTADSALEGHYRVTCEVTHCNGHSKQYHVDMPAETTGFKGGANKTPTHAFGSAMSYGRRYLTLLIFNIATEDDDGAAASESSKTITDAQCNDLLTLADEVGARKDKFCQFFGISAFPELPAKDFGRAKQMLESKRGKA